MLNAMSDFQVSFKVPLNNMDSAPCKWGALFSFILPLSTQPILSNVSTWEQGASAERKEQNILTQIVLLVLSIDCCGPSVYHQDVQMLTSGKDCFCLKAYKFLDVGMLWTAHMFAYKHKRVNTHIYTWTHIFTQTHTHKTVKHSCSDACLHSDTDTLTHTQLHTHTRAHTHVWIHIKNTITHKQHPVMQHVYSYTQIHTTTHAHTL